MTQTTASEPLSYGVRFVCDVGAGASMAQVHRVLGDIDALLTFVADATAILGLSRDDASGQMYWNPDGIRHGKLSDAYPIGRYQYRVARGANGDVSGVEFLVNPARSVDAVRYVSYQNPIDTWVELFAGGGAVGTLVLLGKFLRDFSAERRIRKADAAMAEERVKQERLRTDVEEVRADVLADLLRGLQGTFSEALQGDNADAVRVLGGLASSGRLESMARLAELLVSVEDVTDLTPPALPSAATLDQQQSEARRVAADDWRREREDLDEVDADPENGAEAEAEY